MSTFRITRPAAFVTTQVVLCAAFIVGATSAAPAANSYGSSAEIQRCVDNFKSSGRYHGGGDDDMGVTEYDVMVGRCMTSFYRQRGAR